MYFEFFTCPKYTFLWMQYTDTTVQFTSPWTPEAFGLFLTRCRPSTEYILAPMCLEGTANSRLQKYNVFTFFVVLIRKSLADNGFFSPSRSKSHLIQGFSYLL